MKVQQGGAHLGDHRDTTGRLACLKTAQVVACQIFGRQALRGEDWITALGADSTVKRAGVEMGKAKARGHSAADGAFARSGRAINGYGEDHRFLRVAPQSIPVSLG